MSAPCVRLAPTIDVLSAQYAGRVRVGKLELSSDARPTASYVEVLERHLGPAAVA